MAIFNVLNHKYYDPTNYQTMFTINERSQTVDDMVQVTEDKLAVLLANKVAIHSLVDGSLLLSRRGFNFNKLFNTGNKFVIVGFAVRYNDKRLLVINLEDMQCNEMKVEAKVTNLVHLENGTLIFGGENTSTWKADCWPFERFTGNKSFNEKA